MKNLFLVALVLIFVAGFLMIDAQQVLRVHARADGFHVVIDAGHGGKDKGAESPNGTFERDINLFIARFLKAEFEVRGVGVTMTRETEDWLASPLATNKKRSDLERRRQIIESVRPDLVISIHLNSFPQDTSVRGLQTFYATNSDASRIFAEAIQNEFNRSPLDINRKARGADYYLLEATSFPSVLVECGFLSNPEEERLLGTTEYQRILAHFIASAVMTVRTEKEVMARTNSSNATA